MHSNRISLTLLVLLLHLNLAAQTIQPTQYVNTFVGTNFYGHTFLGAAKLFGMVQLSPDRRIDGSWRVKTYGNNEFRWINIGSIGIERGKTCGISCLLWEMNS